MVATPKHLEHPENTPKILHHKKKNLRNRHNEHINAFKKTAIEKGKRVEEGNRVYYDYRHQNRIIAGALFPGNITRVRVQ